MHPADKEEKKEKQAEVGAWVTMLSCQQPKGDGEDGTETNCHRYQGILGPDDTGGKGDNRQDKGNRQGVNQKMVCESV